MKLYIQYINRIESTFSRLLGYQPSYFNISKYAHLNQTTRIGYLIKDTFYAYCL